MSLNVTYNSQIQPGIAPAGGVTSAAPGEAAESNPLGFLGALLDQILAGGNIETPVAPAATDTDVITPTASPPALPLDAIPAPATVASDTFGENPLAELTVALNAYQRSIDTGTPPSTQQREALTAALDKLATHLSLGAANTTQATTAPQSPAAAPNAPANPIAAILADLGLTKPETSAPAAPAATQIPQQLQQLAQVVTATDPILADKLVAVATAIEQAPPPQALAPEAPEASADDQIIAAMIRSLLGVATTADASDEAPTTDKPAAQPVASPATAPTTSAQPVIATFGITPLRSTDVTAPANTGVGESAGAPVTATTAAVTTAAATNPVTVPAPLVRLSNQLSAAAATVAEKSPELAAKIEAVAARLVTADAGPEIVAALNDATKPGSDPAALERIVRNLIEGKPTTPQTALAQAAADVTISTKLEIPASITPDKTQSAVTGEKAALPQPAPVTADLAPATAAVRMTVENVTREARAGISKPEPAATRIVADTAKPDAPAPQPTAPASTQPPAPIHNARMMPAAYQPVANPINMGQVAFEMVRQVHQGNSRFTIRLDPPELGRIDVKMSVDATGNVNARLTVERAETLDLFQRDQRTLERALAQAGLDSSKTNLEFSLKQNPFGNMAGGDHRQQHQHFGDASPRFRLDDAPADMPSIPAITLYRGSVSAGGVNIFA